MDKSKKANIENVVWTTAIFGSMLIVLLGWLWGLWDYRVLATWFFVMVCLVLWGLALNMLAESTKRDRHRRTQTRPAPPDNDTHRGSP